MSSTGLPSIPQSRQLIQETVRHGDVALVICGQGFSDQLAAEGARALLGETQYREVGLDGLARERGDTAVLLGRGFSRADHDVMPRALAVAELRFRRVVVLPTSFDPSDEVVHGALSRTNAVVFAAEPDSYRRIADLCDARLAHQPSFFFDFDPYRRAGSGVLDLFRPEGEEIAAAELEKWLNRMADHETVRTDQVTAMIAAALMGKRVEYAQRGELGLESVARHALTGCSVAPLPPPTNPLSPAELEQDAHDTLDRLRAAAPGTPVSTSPSSTDPVTAILLTRDRPEFLLRALSSLDDNQTPVQTIVIDNNSAPAAAEAIAAVCEAREDTVLRRSEHNLGCAGGRRLGVELAYGDRVLFLDDDAELVPGALDHLVLELDRHPDVAAVTATVVRPDGTLLHSGGSMEITDEIVTFELLGDGTPFPNPQLPPTGPSGWAPGTALLARKELLIALPFDESMGAYFEDNEWCYRVARSRPGVLWRSSEALALHHIAPKHAPASDFASRSRMVELLLSYARFYELHGALLGPWLFDHLPDLRGVHGNLDLAAARLLMELVTAKGADWTLMAWMNGDLNVLLGDNIKRALETELEKASAEVTRLRAREAQNASTIAALDARLNDATRRIRRIEESVTWQLFQRVRGRAFALLGGEKSRGVSLLQSTLRAIGRVALRGYARRSAQSALGRINRRSPRGGPIDFKDVAAPDVSIVMPLYAHAELTEEALSSILENTDNASYEVILVDDSEDPPTKELLERVSGATVITNESNLGYRRSIHRGAEAASGRWLVLCNNDIEVQPGWLAALLDCGDSAADIGVVTPKYLYPSGALAEAGGIIWRDGTGANYGRGDDPASCHYEYRREVDYGSAAALMVRADFWAEAGGFDQRFDPMYYEDTDLCFEARARGLRVMYEPRSHVVHVEGATAGVDESSSHKRHQLQNRPKFVEKWHSVLAGQHLENDLGNLWLAANLRREPRVLVIDHRVPTWDRDSGGLRMRGLLQELVELGCQVILIPDNGMPMQPYTRELQRMGVEVCYGTDHRHELPRMGPGLSVVILSRASVARRWLEPVREHAPAAQVVFDTVDLHWLREARQAAVARNASSAGDSLPPKVRAMRELELGLMRAADATLVVTEDEKAHVLADVPESIVHVIPNVHEPRDAVPPLEGRSGLVFVGGFEHPPNLDGALMLVNDVMPLVWQEIPDVPVKIVGGDAPDAVRALASERVEVLGWVPDLDSVLDSARALVAPLTFGAGLKGKVTQALAHGLPVVTTPIGAEGLPAADGEHMLVGETSTQLAERVVRVLRDDELWRQLSICGKRLVYEQCSPEVIREQLRLLLDELRPGRPVAPVAPEGALSPQ
jgi:GT2 family glycosyltransferase/glycosyltransferase involved in cell wall biosynthesis